MSIANLAVAEERPNLLLMVVDDMNKDTVGAVIGGEEVTPRISSLKDEGISFERAHVTVAVCQPSRQVLMTGLYPHQNGALGFVPIDESVTTLGEILSANGYYNGIFCKEHHLAPMEKYAWDVVGSSDTMFHGRSTTEFYNRTRDFIQEAQQNGQPFFLMANSEDPHRPLHGSRDEMNKYGPGGLDILKHFSTPSYEFTADEVDSLMPWVDHFNFNSNARQKSEEDLAAYYSSSRRADDSIRRILEALDELGESDNTIVVFMSDNGMAFPGAKWQTYQAATRTPFIVRWPDGGIVGGTVNAEDFISNIDFMPTILEAVGLQDQTPSGLPGESFFSLLTGGTSPGRDSVVTAHYSATAPTPLSQDSIDRGYSLPPVGSPVNPKHIRCYQDDQYAYIYNHWSDQLQTYILGGDGGMGNFIKNTNVEEIIEYRDFLYYRVPEEFYDLRNDPHSMNNLIDDPAYQDVIESYRDKLRNWMVREGDDKLADHDALRAALASPPVEPMIGSAINYVDNPGFENGALGQGAVPDAWQTGAETDHVNLIWTEELDGNRVLMLHKNRINRDPFDPAYEIRMYNPSTDDFTATAYQTITGLPDGTYCFKAEVRKQGAFYKKAHLFVENHGGGERRAVVPSSLDMQHVFIRDIEVTNGECTIGIEVDVFAGMWPVPYVYMDEVELFLQEEGTTNQAPYFPEDPVVLSDAFTNAEYIGSLDGKAVDPEERELIYTKVSGPAWLHVAVDGTLSGVPAITDLGTGEWTIRVQDPQGGANTGTLEITVIPAPDLSAGYTVLIDMESVAETPTVGGIWNVIPTPSGTTELLTTTSYPSPLMIGSWGGLQDKAGLDSVDNPNAFDFEGSGWELALEDGFVTTPSGTGTFTLSGFNASDEVEIHLLPLAGAAVGKDGDYQINDQFGEGDSPANGDNYNARLQAWMEGVYMTWNLTGETAYTITVAPVDGSRPVINAVRVYVEGQATPEVDSDGDGLSDHDEMVIGTNPNDPDSDGDGLSDLVEFALSGSGTDATRDNLPVLLPNGGAVEYEIGRAHTPGVTYAVYLSQDLHGWHRIAYRDNTDGTWRKDVDGNDGTTPFSQIDEISVTGTPDGVRITNNAAMDAYFFRTTFQAAP